MYNCNFSLDQAEEQVMGSSKDYNLDTMHFEFETKISCNYASWKSNKNKNRLFN